MQEAPSVARIACCVSVNSTGSRFDAMIFVVVPDIPTILWGWSLKFCTLNNNMDGSQTTSDSPFITILD